MKNRAPAGELSYPMIAARCLNVPLMITDAKMEAILSVIGPRMGLAGYASAPQAAGSPGPFVDSTNLDRIKRKPLAVNNHGIAVIDVVGTLVSDTNGLYPWSGMTPYQGIAHDIETAEADGRVRGILFRIDSSGGEALAVFDLADAIFACKKTTAAVCADRAMSAAYLIACAAGKVFTTQNGMLGSIGVISRHVDRSAANAEAGIKITNIFRGARKADYTESLNDDSTREITAHVESMYQLFVAKVAQFRGLSADAIIAQESRIYHGTAALEQGLADDVKTESQALEWLAETTANGGQFLNPRYKEPAMNKGQLSTAAAALLAATSLAGVALSPANEGGGGAPAPEPKTPAPKTAADDAAEEEEEEAEEDAGKPGETAPKDSAQAALIADFVAKNPAAAAAMRTEAAAAERTRISTIGELCVEGEEAIRDELIANGTTVADAGVALAAKRKERKKATRSLRAGELNDVRVPGGASEQGAGEGSAAAGDTDTPADAEEAKFRAEYKADPEFAKELGGGEMGFKMFVAYRRSSAGKNYTTPPKR